MAAQGRIVWVSGPAVRADGMSNAKMYETVTVGNSLSFTVGATDVDGDTPIFHSVSLPAGSTLSARGEFSWPSATPSGNYVMTYYASDLDANSAQGTVNITVADPQASTSSGGGGGGCSIPPNGSESGAVYLLMPLLLLLGYKLRRRFMLH